MPKTAMHHWELGDMIDLIFRVVDKFPEPAFSTLAGEAFSDYELSDLLSEVLNEEEAAKSGTLNAAEEGVLRIGAFRGDSLIGWTFARARGTDHFHMINSGGRASGETSRGLLTPRTIGH